MGLVVEERAGDAPPVRAPRWFEHPPQWFFHAILIVPTAMLLLAASVPGTMFFLGIAAVWLLAIGGLLWLVRIALYVSARVRGRSAGSPLWCLVAPAAGCVVVAMLVVDAPLRLRWAGSRSDFARAVADAPSPRGVDRRIPFAVERHLGSYEVISGIRAGDAVFFYESSGAFLDHAGFAYLPSGPESLRGNAGFESPQFTELGGGWYAWTASW